MAGMPGAGPLGSGWTAGTPGGGSDGAALARPNPKVTVEIPTLAAIVAAAVKRLMFIVRVPPQTFTTLVANCLVGYAGKYRRRKPISPFCLCDSCEPQSYV